jgi:hypothetical protein
LAPGDRIFSTYPRNLGKYATISGKLFWRFFYRYLK